MPRETTSEGWAPPRVVSRWDNRQIVAENLFYDLVIFIKQIGLSG
jgi:hypothetical protein